MKALLILTMLWLTLAPQPAGAQQIYEQATGRQYVIPVLPGGGTSPPGTTMIPPAGTPTEVAVSCANTTTLLLAAAAVTQFALIKNPATNPIVWINFAGAAATGAPPDFDLGPGMTIKWTEFLPISQWNCKVASGSASLTIIYK